MTKTKILRIDEKLAEKFENDAKQKNKSENEWLIEAVEHFLKCKKAEPAMSMTLIVTRYDGHCIKCAQKVPSGSWALYAKSVGILCMDCYITRIGDKALIAKFLKMRELKQIIKALQNQADKLADKVEVFTAGEKLYALTEQWEKLTKLIMNYLTAKLGRPEEKEAFEEIMREKTVTETLIRDIEAFIKQYVQTRKWRKIPAKEEAYS